MTTTALEPNQDIVLALNHLTSNTEPITWANANRLLYAHQPELRKHATSIRKATFHIGSDCYAKEVESVEVYKSGAKSGEVKAITTTDGNRFTLRADGKMRLDGFTTGALIVGIANDYRDPSF